MEQCKQYLNCIFSAFTKKALNFLLTIYCIFRPHRRVCVSERVDVKTILIKLWHTCLIASTSSYLRSVKLEMKIFILFGIFFACHAFMMMQCSAKGNRECVAKGKKL